MEEYISNPRDWPKVKETFDLPYSENYIQESRRAYRLLTKVESLVVRWEQYRIAANRRQPEKKRDMFRTLEREHYEFVNELLEQCSRIKMLLVLSQNNH